MGLSQGIWKSILTFWLINNLVFAGKKEEVLEESKPETKLSHHGVSRFDVTGILTAFGMKQGASMFALVLFPILFPLMILLGLALFIISLFGAGGVTAVGRRSDLIANANRDSFGYSSLLQDTLGVDDYTFSRDSNAFLSKTSLANAMDNDACLEKLVCELLLHYGGSKIIGGRTTFEILRELNVKPLLVPNPSLPDRKSRKVWKCSTLKCNWDR